MKGSGAIRKGYNPGPWERSILEEGRLFLVGGSVRDLISGKDEETVDSDYVVTGISLERLLKILTPQGKTDLVGRSFGVIKFRPAGGREVDISMPRKESSTGSGHRDFDVEFDPSIPVEEDLVRRDFTINSMALDIAGGRLIDPLGGRKDLEDSLLRVNRETSFIEDPLRMLRGVQLMARFSLRVERGTRDLMTRNASLISTVSAERLRMELTKLLTLAPAPSAGILLMHETGLLEHILPELEAAWGVEQNEFHIEDVFSHSVHSCDLAPPVLHDRIAALLHDLGKVAMKKDIDGRTVFYGHDNESARMAEEILRRLTYPNETIEKVGHLIRNHMFFMTEEWSDSAVRRFIARVGVENIDDLMILRIADGTSRGESGRETLEEVEYARKRIADVLKRDSAFARKDLAITGDDIMKETGLAEGPGIGKVLDILLDEVLEDPGLNNRKDLLEIARRHLPNAGEKE
ncbi:MAG TPA: HD domain-containing protein [Candidatus Krumholzibacterium sp.]|nr:HD domain-containing protein [Candidatus Krumholzibacterium sp.]